MGQKNVVFCGMRTRSTAAARVPATETGEHRIAAVATRFSFELPDASALAALLREEAFRYSRDHDGRRVVVDADAARAVVRNLKGLSLEDARRIVRKLIYDDGARTAAERPHAAPGGAARRFGTSPRSFPTSRTLGLAAVRRSRVGGTS